MEKIKIPITESIKFNKPSLERDHSIVKEGGEGKQKFWRYKNNYGVSAVKFKIKTTYLKQPIGNYGIENGLWEIAILKFKSNDET